MKRRLLTQKELDATNMDNLALLKAQLAKTDEEYKPLVEAGWGLLQKAIDLEAQVTDTWASAEVPRPRRLLAKTAIKKFKQALAQLAARKEK